MALHARFRPAARFAAAALALGMVIAALTVTVAGAGPGRYVTASDNNLWATINACHGHKKPPSMGVRAHMPVDNQVEREYMRFFAQYKSGGKWHFLKKGGDSGWQSAYTGPFMSQEFGWNFKFDEPGAGKSFLMRGLVKFKWRQNGQVVRRAQRVTTGHHPTGSSSHPYSAAHCRIYGPPATPHA